jgi:hypothetical protein
VFQQCLFLFGLLLNRPDLVLNLLHFEGLLESHVLGKLLLDPGSVDMVDSLVGFGHLVEVVSVANLPSALVGDQRGSYRLELVGNDLALFGLLC